MLGIVVDRWLDHGKRVDCGLALFYRNRGSVAVRRIPEQGSLRRILRAAALSRIRAGNETRAALEQLLKNRGLRAVGLHEVHAEGRQHNLRVVAVDDVLLAPEIP